ncbi:hypothetical protein [Nonomuraea zeae]|uniref:Uncharacterized protein n=1 Tax=Nonomuraea zeae TaxID=1642303 RepID=A0A5S4FFP5_9ACTN|nr:hypothetical protein [Nonomuraea zeae]TMR18000.1 hypothetical protein ETD85_53985 [Nonomuraea zeae]
MTDPVAEAARTVAHRLAPHHGPSLITDVEVALHEHETQERKPDQYLDPVSLASLIVSAAALGWTVYQDLRKRTTKPPAGMIVRTVRAELRHGRVLTPEEDEILSITVQETITAVGEDED